MSTEVIVWVLTALAAVVVLLTRLRLSREEGAAGRIEVGTTLLGVHTTCGTLALLFWLAFLLAGERVSEGTSSILGIVALGFWWLVVVAGLLILVRWLPSRGKHAADGREDTWSEGPGLSVLAHVGMLVGVVVFTYAYVVAAV